LNYCKNTKNLSESSLNAYSHDLNSFAKIIGPIRNSADITRQDLYHFIETLFNEGRSAATVKRRVACLKTLFRWLENEQSLGESPFSRFELKIKIPKRLPRNIKVHELRSMVQTARAGMPEFLSSEQCLRKRDICAFNALVIVELLYSTGIRVSELTSIMLDDINFHTNSIHINGKGQRERKVFLPDEDLVQLVRAYIRARNFYSLTHNHLLINSLGKPLSSQSARLIVKKNAEKAQIQRSITPHMYRHSTATQLLEAGIDIRYVQQLLGHESIQTTQIYTHVENPSLREHIVKADIRRAIL